PLSPLSPLFLSCVTSPPGPTPFPYTTLFRSVPDTEFQQAIQPKRLQIAPGLTHWLGTQLLQVGLEPRIIDTPPWTLSRFQTDLRSEEHTSELQSRENLVCRLLLEKKKRNTMR